MESLLVSPPLKAPDADIYILPFRSFVLEDLWVIISRNFVLAGEKWQEATAYDSPQVTFNKPCVDLTDSRPPPSTALPLKTLQCRVRGFQPLLRIFN